MAHPLWLRNAEQESPRFIGPGDSRSVGVPVIPPRPQAFRLGFESVYCILTLIYLSSPFWGVFTAQDDAPAASNPVELGLQAVVYFLAGVFILKNWPAYVSGLYDARWAITLVGLAVISAAWANDPLLVVRKGALLAATTAFGIYFGTRFNRDEQVDLLCCALGLIALMSLLLVAILPEYGIDPASDRFDWRGVFETKNMLGRIMVLGLISVRCSGRKWLSKGVPFLFWATGIGIVIMLTGSMTAILTAIILLGLIIMCGFFLLRVTAQVAIAMFSLSVLTVFLATVMNYKDTLLAFIARDASLGRTPLWASVLSAIGSRPLLGYGFSSFWLGLNGPSAAVARMVGWIPPHAHNGFLDLCLELGCVGILIFSVGFLLRLRSAIAEFRADSRRATLWPLAFLGFLVLYNLTESTLLHPNNLFWALYAASLVSDLHSGPIDKGQAFRLEECS